MSVSRRGFLETLGNTALVSALAKQRLFRLTGTAGPSALLTQNDFTYLGFCKVPVTAASSNALSTGIGAFRRYTDGFGTNTLRVILSASTLSNWSGDIWEFSLPSVASLGTTIAGAPTATMLQGWTCWGSLTIPGDFTGVVGGSPLICNGLEYIEDGNGPEIISSALGVYNALTGDCPILRTLIPDGAGGGATAGPWGNRTLGAILGAGPMMLTPSYFQALTGCGNVCATQSIRTQLGPVNGAVFYGYTLPSRATPKDTPNASPAGGSIASLLGVGYNIVNPQPRTFDVHNKYNGPSNTQGCTSVDTSVTDWTPGAYFNGASNVDGVHNATNPDGTAFSIAMDWMDTGVFIKTANKRGILYFGQMMDYLAGYPYAAGDNKNRFWYGTDQSCQSPVANAMNPGTTGPHCETLLQTGWIFDPNDIASAMAGSIPTAGSGAPMPVSEFRLSAFANGGFSTGLVACGFVPDADYRHFQHNFGRMWFDTTTNILWVTQWGAWVNGLQYDPIIHAFSLDNP